MSHAKSSMVKSPEAYRSIGEAAAEIGLQTHVLRYWEGKFPRLIKPVKRRDGRRMFRPGDMAALRAVQILVHERGMTLKGARGLLEEQGVAAVLNGLATVSPNAPLENIDGPARHLQKKLVAEYENTQVANDADGDNARLKSVLSEMNELKARLDAARLKAAA